MTISDIMRRAWRNLAQSKGRTFLTSLAIAVGAVTITLAMAAGAGGRNYVDTIVNTAGDVQTLSVYQKVESVESTENNMTEYGATEEENGETARRGMMSDADITKIENIDGVESAIPSYYVEAEYVTRGGDAKKWVASTMVQTERAEKTLAAGSLDDNTIPAGSVVIPQEYLENLGFASAQEAIGQPLLLRFVNQTDQSEKDVTYTVAAVEYQADAVVYYTMAIWLSAEDGADIYHFQNGDAGNQYYGANVRVEKGYDIDTVKNEIAQNYEAYSLADQKEDLMQAVNIVQWGLVGFGALAILASIFGIINTQYISVLERTQQIGLMKALGMRRRDIARLFRFEAAWVGFLGGLIGTGIAVLIGLIANPIITEQLKLEAGTKLLIFEPLSSVILILALILVAVASGYFPSRRAAKLDPIEALRTE